MYASFDNNNNIQNREKKHFIVIIITIEIKMIILINNIKTTS